MADKRLLQEMWYRARQKQDSKLAERLRMELWVRKWERKLAKLDRREGA